MSRVVELLCSRRVPQVAVLALMSVGFAGCSADMSTRLSQNSFSNPFASQPEATGSVAAAPAPVERRELPQYARPQSAAYQSQALPPPIAAPQSYPAAQCRRVRRRARAVAPTRRRRIRARDHRHGRAAFGRGRPNAAGAGRHHDHRRHQRHAGNPGAPLQRFDRRDPAGQRLQGPARAVARPAADHSAPDAAVAAPAPARRSGQQAGRVPRAAAAAFMSSIAATR